MVFGKEHDRKHKNELFWNGISKLVGGKIQRCYKNFLSFLWAVIITAGSIIMGATFCFNTIHNIHTDIYVKFQKTSIQHLNL